MDGIEQVRARNRQRYYDRIDRLKATGQYEAYKKKKVPGRIAALPHHAGGAKGLEGQNDPGGQLQGIPTTPKCAAARTTGREKTSYGNRGWKALQRVKYAKWVESEHRRRWQWLDEQLARPFPLPWLSLDWAESEPEEDTVQTIRVNALQ